MRPTSLGVGEHSVQDISPDLRNSKILSMLQLVHFGIIQIGIYHVASAPIKMPRMEKSAFTAEHRILVVMLREQREKASLTQTELATKLKVSQSFVSKWERGDRRIDLVQLRHWCRATGISLARFATMFEKRL